ncbi:hypothetical protein Bhyg_11033, partial [Pseudolycoriella hygida]
VGNGELILNLNLQMLRQQTRSKCDLSGQTQCSSDCLSILVCTEGNETPVKSIKCNSETPFCDGGICTTAPGNCSLNVRRSNYFCTSTGLFPDPTDCTKYFSCSQPGSMSTEFLCPVGSIYNS